jgi:hypothetical protein
VGFYLADELVKGLDLPLDRLAALSVEGGVAAIRQELGLDPHEPRPGAH